jgi:hypothetical protein
MPSDKLEVVRWTATWRDEILGDIDGDTLTLEIWINSASQAGEISHELGSNSLSRPHCSSDKSRWLR